MSILLNQHSIILVCIGLLIPIGLSLLRLLPIPKKLTAMVTSYLITPATWGTKHRQPIANLGFCPTRGQSLFISLLVILNLIFCFTKYPAEYVAFDKQARYRTRTSQIMVIMANRFAVMCLANLALLVLYAGRNNFLLWITKWQRETFLLFHHWLGYMVIIGGVLHAMMMLFLALTSGRYAAGEYKELFWKFGAVAIIALTLILPLSILPIRVRAYEIFLTLHRLLALLALAAALIHVYVESHDTGLHHWIYAALGALAFDYCMRVVRLLRHGVRKATVTIVDNDYLRVDIPGLTAEGHAYIYFPTLTWRFWDNVSTCPTSDKWISILNSIASLLCCRLVSCCRRDPGQENDITSGRFGKDSGSSRRYKAACQQFERGPHRGYSVPNDFDAALDSRKRKHYPNGRYHVLHPSPRRSHQSTCLSYQDTSLSRVVIRLSALASDSPKSHRNRRRRGHRDCSSSA